MAREWTDDRLDGLNEKVDCGFAEIGRRFNEVDRRFDEVDRRFDEMNHQVDWRFKEVNKQLDKVDAQLTWMDDRLDSIQRAMIYGIVSITGGMLAGFSAILVLIATQL